MISPTSPDPKAPDMPDMPESDANDMGPQGVQNESTGGYGVAHDADPKPPILQRPGTKSGLGVATPIAAAQAALPSALVPPPAPLPMINTGPGQIPPARQRDRDRRLKPRRCKLAAGSCFYCP